MADEQGFLKVRYSTAGVLAAIIFVANLFSGWLTQNREIASVQAEVKTLAVRGESNVNRISLVEQCVRDMKEDLKEIKVDLKELNRLITQKGINGAKADTKGR